MKRITLMPNPYRDRGYQITRAAEHVLKQSGAQVKICLPFHVDRNHEIPAGLRLVPMEEALRNCEALVCFGGDGTILHAARLIGNRDIPMLGVNTGTMGFMAELESDEISLLSRLLEDSYSVDSRMMIHVVVRRNGRVIYEDNALNDAVVTKGAVARVIQMTILCDNQEAMKFDGDGVTISTPTGSTAYSMSAGGPIVEPEAKNIIVTPICPHAMRIRSLVLSKERTVTVRIGRIGKRNAFLSVDGGKAFRLNAEDEVVVTTSARYIKLLHVKNNSFYGVLNRKIQG
jgi:NAD+ kinase